MFRIQVLVQIVVLCGAFFITGCASDGTLATGATLQDHSIPESEKKIAEAKLQFSEGNYGKAVDAYSKTVEVDPSNPDAWLGLAASYDQVRRFDQADKAYEKVQQLVGPTPKVLNNIGYSFLLRGNLEQSRETLVAARKGDPENPYILNNIDILNERLVAIGKDPISVE